MNIDPSEAFQVLMGILLGVIGFQLKQALNRLDTLTKGQASNTYRLVRIETKLGIPELNHMGDME